MQAVAWKSEIQNRFNLLFIVLLTFMLFLLPKTSAYFFFCLLTDVVIMIYYIHIKRQPIVLISKDQEGIIIHKRKRDIKIKYSQIMQIKQRSSPRLIDFKYGAIIIQTYQDQYIADHVAEVDAVKTNIVLSLKDNENNVTFNHKD